ncbi:signal peptide peptidase-domain-containing protein [Xylariaceae sp. FL0662B]|nr:signal peptide peptidase-domain-containing protein [Xylariaceae sp. FL0662B]
MASNNSTLGAWREISATDITGSVVANMTFLDKLSMLPTVLFENGEYLLIECRIIFAALACIYIGSHGALRRPPSARLSKKGKKGGRPTYDEQLDRHVEGLLPSDAIILPIMAGTSLTGLYYLIKWLENLDFLNKILQVYCSIMSLASMGKLFADLLHLVTGFIFPSVWAAKDGKLYHVDPKGRRCYSISDSGDQVWDDKKKTPLPGLCSGWNLSASKNNLLWGIRHLLSEQWTVRFSVHGIVNEKFYVKFNDIFGVVLAVGAVMVYHTTNSSILSNIMGYAFSYAGIIIMSPTTFGTGTAVLFGLFFYDIYMVFFTPYMVTVATKLDVPIKLVFEGPTKASMLGLGDIILPGIFVALCLRFDHYLYYYRQRKLVPVQLRTEDKSSGEVIANHEMQRMVVRPDYVNPQGQWGDYFWSTKLGKIFSPDATPALKASAFPKTYFHAAMVGYLIAMVITLAMLLLFRQAQPALLYLVPGVVFAAWFTGVVRGELREMWAYTEDGGLDVEDVIVEVDGNGNPIKTLPKDKDDKKDKGKTTVGAGSSASRTEGEKSPADKSSVDETVEKPDKSADKGADAKGAKEPKKSGRYPVFLFSIEAPEPHQTRSS